MEEQSVYIGINSINLNINVIAKINENKTTKDETQIEEERSFSGIIDKMFDLIKNSIFLFIKTRVLFSIG